MVERVRMILFIQKSNKNCIEDFTRVINHSIYIIAIGLPAEEFYQVYRGGEEDHQKEQE